MKKEIVIALSIAILTTACAKPAKSIKAVNLDGNYFSGFECQQLANEIQNEKRSLSGLSKKQDGAAIGDAIGVFLILIPTSSLMGADKESAVAFSKGRLNALANAYNQKKCSEKPIVFEFKESKEFTTNDIIYDSEK